jgi:hypothetical protein
LPEGDRGSGVFGEILFGVPDGCAKITLRINGLKQLVDWHCEALCAFVFLFDNPTGKQP